MEPRRNAAGSAGRPVEFSILTSNNNPERLQMATLIQDDLKQIGMRVNVVPLEFRSLLETRPEHATNTKPACSRLASPDADPNPDMAVWLSSGGNHLWNPEQKTPATPWEAEIDGLMRRQMVTRRYSERKRLFDRVQADRGGEPAAGAAGQPQPAGRREEGSGQLPAGALEPYTLWNIDQLYWRAPRRGRPMSQPSRSGAIPGWCANAWPATSAPGALCWIATRT